MAKSVQKITLSSSRDIPFDKLVLSQSNVRHVKAGVSIEELAEDIARRGLLMGLSVRAVVDEAGVETGMYEIPAGGRRYRALASLVKQRRLAKTAPVPCVVRTDGLAEEDSLAENIQRAPLHPLDQFRAFLALPREGAVRGGDRRQSVRVGRRGEAAPAAGVGQPQAARRLRGGRHEPGPAYGLHHQRRSCSPGAGVRAAVPVLRQVRPHHPAHADRGRSAGVGQAGAVHRRGRLCRGWRHDPERPVPGR